MAITFSKKMLVERVKKHLANGFPGVDFRVSTNEMLLYIDSFIPVVMKSQIYENFKVAGIFEVPDAYILTYQYSIANQNTTTFEWYVTLPQPPLALPTGYDLTAVNLSASGTGLGQAGYPIKPKRQSYREFMPKPSGFSYRVEGNRLFMKNNDGSSLYGYYANVQMPISRTDDINGALYMPDDAISAVFDMVVAKIQGRRPVDVVKDELPIENTKTK